jgi:integrase
MAVFQKYKNGNWYMEFWYRDPATGNSKRFRRSTGPKSSKKQAQKLEREWKRELEIHGSLSAQKKPKAVKIKPKGTPFSGFARKFIEDYAKVHNKPSEVDSKMRIIRNHLHPFFGDTPIQEIRRRHIDAFIAEKKRSGLNPKTINNILGTLSRLFNVAVEWELIQGSPMKGVRKLKEGDDSFDFYKADETNRFLAECQKSESHWSPFFMTAFNTGMRLGELAALRWDDMDFDTNLIQVRRSIWRGHEGTPKSGKSRQIPMNPQLRKVLQDHGGGKRPTERVFRSASGTDIKENSHRKAYDRIIKRAGLKHIKFHEAGRHSFASQLAINGVPLNRIQKLLGHSTISMTERYSHLTPNETQEAVDTLNGGLVNSGGQKSAPHSPPIVDLEEYRKTSEKKKARKHKGLRAV